jgi:hypothetical protein
MREPNGASYGNYSGREVFVGEGDNGEQLARRGSLKINAEVEEET